MPKRNLFVLLMMFAIAGVAWLARDRDGHGRRFAEVLGTIERSYLEPVNQQSLFDAAMEGVFSRLDEHSAFVTGERREQFESLLDQQFGGVGLELVEGGDPRTISVVSPVLSGPAWQAGIATGDQILAIDDVPTRQMKLTEVFRRLRGKPGTAVGLSIAAAVAAASTDNSPTAPARDVQLVREVVKTESVLGDRRRQDGSWEWAIEGEPAAAIIRIQTFGERTADEVRRAVEAIATQFIDGADRADEDRTGQVAPPHGMLIVDLRGNAGGLLTAAVDVCDIFLDDGVIVSTRGRGVHNAVQAGDDAVALDIRRATRGVALADLPMAVLVDGLTASAAEVMAACLQDHGRAIVVGSQSFGKGTVQSIQPLSDNSGLVKLTTAEYLRPSRVNIHRRNDDDFHDTWGVRPNSGCEITPNGRQIEAVRAWRQARDVVPAKAGVVGAEPPQSHATLPRQIDLVLAAGLEALTARRQSQP